MNRRTNNPETVICKEIKKNKSSKFESLGTVREKTGISKL